MLEYYLALKIISNSGYNPEDKTNYLKAIKQTLKFDSNDEYHIYYGHLNNVEILLSDIGDTIIVMFKFAKVAHTLFVDKRRQHAEFFFKHEEAFIPESLHNSLNIGIFSEHLVDEGLPFSTESIPDSDLVESYLDFVQFVQERE